jgi:hypothetical protein
LGELVGGRIHVFNKGPAAHRLGVEGLMFDVVDVVVEV